MSLYPQHGAWLPFTPILMASVASGFGKINIELLLVETLTADDTLTAEESYDFSCILPGSDGAGL